MIYKSGYFKFSLCALLMLSFFVFLAVDEVEAAQTQAPGLDYQVCQNFDIIYVLDLSGSMNWGYGGEGTRLDAAKEAIIQMNDVLEEDGAGVEAALLTWQGLSTNLAVDFTNDFASISSALGPLTAGGGTPTAQALYATIDTINSIADPESVPVVIFITDGIPTYDLAGYGYWDYYVNDVPIINPYGGYYSSNWVRYQGVYYYDYGRYAGHPLADAMVAAEALSGNLGDGVLNSISILGTDFRQDFLHYAAHVGGGGYFGASNSSQLAAAIQQSIYAVDCPSSLELNADNSQLFPLGSPPTIVDPTLTVIGENEQVSSATVHLAENFDPLHDSLFIGSTPAESGTYNGLSWWYQAGTGTLEVIGIASPEAYQAVLREVRFANSATSEGATNMDQRRVNFAITSAYFNVYDPGSLTDDAYIDPIILEGTDFGDAPSSYGDGAVAANMFLRLGERVDVENSPLYSENALGDDTDQTDDEDGITFVDGTMFYRGGIGTAEVAVLNQVEDGATVEGWIDFNRDGVFDDAAEKLIGFGLTFNQQTGVQVQQDSFAIPGDSDCGLTIARFRLTSLGVGASAASSGFGETEDYRVEISCETVELPEIYDFGDAPSSYGDAQHIILEGMTIGSLVDSEPLALNSADASGDDITEDDDEDGVSFPGGDSVLRNSTNPIKIRATNAVHLSAYLNGWVDWNQDGVFDPVNEQIVYDELLSLSGLEKTIVTNFVVPADAACGDTFVRVRLASDPVDPTEVTTSGEVEDLTLNVDCTVEQGIRITPSLAEVQLEESVNLAIEADNTGPNAAPNALVLVTLPVGVDVQAITPFDGWACALIDSDTKLSCEKPLMPIGGYAPVATLTVRVPGTFLPSELSGAGTISSDYPERVGFEADNEATYTVPVEKEWTSITSPTSLMRSFTHVIYDDALSFDAADKEQDFEAGEIVVNPFQVPMSLVPSLDVTHPPTLTAKYCTNNMTDGCETETAILTGTVRLNEFTIDTIVQQALSDTGAPYDPIGAPNLANGPISIPYGADGRLVEADLATCESWIALLGGGNCTTRYDVFKGYPDSARYVWGSTEYLEVIMHLSGGRPINCSGSSGGCEVLDSAKPGVYRISGVMTGDMVFYDPVHQRIGSEVKEFDFEYPVDIYIRVVSSFIDPEG